jgi:NAD(P)-dependent dehydrogenase (short-subunit alcohol dehydrogenase family)
MSGKDAFIAKLSDSCAVLGRVGTLQDVASLVSFLASPDSRQVTGHTVSLACLALCLRSHSCRFSKDYM